MAAASQTVTESPAADAIIAVEGIANPVWPFRVVRRATRRDGAEVVIHQGMRWLRRSWLPG
jgi:hypothetical protein